MSIDPAATAEEFFVTPEQLCIGLYVYVDLPWFSHPFSFNHFKIKSADQIATLRGLGVKRFRVDPERSEGNVLPTRQAPPEPAATAPAAAAEVLSNDPVQAARQERAARLRERHDKIASVDKAFAKAAGIMRRLNRDLMSRPRECVEEAGAMVDQMVSSFLDSPEVALHVMGEKAGAEEVYFHGLNTAVLCMILAKGMNLPAEDGRLLGMGALMHDIGLMDIPDKVLKKTGELNHAERELRKMHSEYGLRTAQKVGLPPVVQAIIAQHHEFSDGSGYPKALSGNAIHPLARIVAVVNYYDNLCNPTDMTRALTPHEALSLMFAKLRGKFDGPILQLMIRSLGVYPPGTIVKLSDESVALVQSVNPDMPLRPWVMVYDPSVPKEEALMLNLEVEQDINISSALRPVQLPAHIFEYLSPRRRVTYYFDGDAAGAAQA